MRKTPLIVSAALIAAATLLPVAQGVAADLSSPVTAPPTTVPGQLATDSFGGIIVDSAHHHLFILGSIGSDALLVTDDAGNTVTNIPMADAADAVLSNGYLYVADEFGYDIAVIDTSTLEIVKRISTQPQGCPDSVTIVADRYLVYTTGCRIWTNQKLVVVDLDSANGPSVLALDTQFVQPIVRAIPNSTRVVVVNKYGNSAAVVDVGGTPSIVAFSPALSNDCFILEDVAVSPDGTSVLPACLFPAGTDAFSSDGLMPGDSYPTPGWSEAIAFSAEGNLLAVGTLSSVELYTFGAAGNKVATPIDLGANNDINEGGLAFSADGKTLFAVTTNLMPVGPPTYDLHVVSLRSTEPHMDLAAPPLATVGTPLEVEGNLLFADGSQRDGTQITVTRTVKGVTTTLPPLTTSLGDNIFSLVDTPTTVGRRTYTFVYGGDPLDRKKTASITVNVEKAHAALSITSHRGTSGTATVTATLVGGSANRTVTITATPSKGKTVVIASGPVDSLGHLTASYAQKTTTKFRVTYAGDDEYRSGWAQITASADISPTPPTPDPTRTATIAVENITSDNATVVFGNDGGFSKTQIVKARGVDESFDYSTCDPAVLCHDWIAVTTADGMGDADPGDFFAAGHSYLVQVAYQPSLYSGPGITFNVIQVS